MAILRNPNHPGDPLHPGAMLREEFMVPLGISANALAMALRVPSTRISELWRSGGVSVRTRLIG